MAMSSPIVSIPIPDCRIVYVWHPWPAISCRKCQAWLLQSFFWWLPLLSLSGICFAQCRAYAQSKRWRMISSATWRMSWKHPSRLLIPPTMPCSTTIPSTIPTKRKSICWLQTSSSNDLANLWKISLQWVWNAGKPWNSGRMRCNYAGLSRKLPLLNE